jgi:hypothetical protein
MIRQEVAGGRPSLKLAQWEGTVELSVADVKKPLIFAYEWNVSPPTAATPGALTGSFVGRFNPSSTFTAKEYWHWSMLLDIATIVSP